MRNGCAYDTSFSYLIADRLLRRFIIAVRCFGTWLNLAEHLIWVQGVVGSNPVVPI